MLCQRVPYVHLVRGSSLCPAWTPCMVPTCVLRAPGQNHLQQSAFPLLLAWSFPDLFGHRALGFRIVCPQPFSRPAPCCWPCPAHPPPWTPCPCCLLCIAPSCAHPSPLFSAMCSTSFVQCAPLRFALWYPIFFVHGAPFVWHAGAPSFAQCAHAFGIACPHPFWSLCPWLSHCVPLSFALRARVLSVTPRPRAFWHCVFPSLFHRAPPHPGYRTV